MVYDASNIKVIKKEDIDYSSVDISLDAFQKNLYEASVVARDFARTMVLNTLPDQVNYRIYNGIMKNDFMEEGEIVIEDAVYDGYEVETEKEVVACLWRGGYVPVWVNVQVERQTDTRTVISLICGSRFANTAKLMYHIHEGRAPFHVLGPLLPPGWESVEKDGKYDIYWREKNA